MVARINTGKTISKALNYNEKKVQEGQAEYLRAENFSKDIQDMNFYEKLKSFEKLTSLNERTATNTLHVSLNFDPSEKISNEKMVSIAQSYMSQIGFGNQPFLVYRHHDTGHPHIHIVSTNIQKDGSRISMHKLGSTKSETARKQIENSFHLVKAESKSQKKLLKLTPLNAQKITSGKRSTKAAISNVLGVVIPQYKYGSLAELNAILGLYNIKADRCAENSQTYQHRGLVYRVLDENGHATGTPIKASLFYMKPTLANLEKRFEENLPLKQPQAKRLKLAIDYTLFKQPTINLQGLQDALKRDSISTVLRQNKEGSIYGVTFIDHKTKTVFNGSELGRQYSAKVILERCTHPEIKAAPSRKEQIKPIADQLKSDPVTGSPPASSIPGSNPALEKFLPLSLLAAENLYDPVPYQLRKMKKKRRKRMRL